MFRHSPTHLWPSAIIYHKYIYSHLYQGKQTILGSSSLSSHPAWIYSTETVSAPEHPLISTSPRSLLLPACISLKPIIIPYSKKPLMACVSQLSEQKQNGSSARSTGKRRRSLSLINAHICGDFLWSYNEHFSFFFSVYLSQQLQVKYL